MSVCDECGEEFEGEGEGDICDDCIDDYNSLQADAAWEAGDAGFTPGER